MTTSGRKAAWLCRIAAVFGVTGIGAAAFGAHGLQKVVAQQQVVWWSIAVAIQLVTAPAILVIGALVPRLRPVSGYLLSAGVVLFSGTLYAMSLGAARWLGAITPLGGLLLMVGWSVLLFTGFTVTDEREG